ncbi:hypothetical protein [Paracoccus aminophilus]|uniref:Cytochrome C oxidase assembly protein n=1 Tax=Paracoccus aminophilus JCM 7686 TaxID=1367847 RepID=S5XX55_PARAH|nr:hypothetical protein [Paracoccus aminophilus]AGT08025.1 cytochrome C oxidase assembly protein [Paracoccus aminophilus JCM 7686]
MALRPEHEIHQRRRGRNVGLLVVLLMFVALVFGLSIVKIQQGDLMEGFDHQFRASALPRTEPIKPGSPDSIARSAKPRTPAAVSSDPATTSGADAPAAGATTAPAANSEAEATP